MYLFIFSSFIKFIQGGGGCDTGGAGGGYAGGDIVNSTNGEGGTSYLGLTRSVRELSFVYPGSNSGHGSVILIPAIEGCGCDYRCVALDEYRSLVACICPEGLRLKPDNLTACECKDLFMIIKKKKIMIISFAVIEEPSSNDILVYLLIVITSVLAVSLIFLFTMLCEYHSSLKNNIFKIFNSFNHSFFNHR